MQKITSYLAGLTAVLFSLNAAASIFWPYELRALNRDWEISLSPDDLYLKALNAENGLLVLIDTQTLVRESTLCTNSDNPKDLRLIVDVYRDVADGDKGLGKTIRNMRINYIVGKDILNYKPVKSELIADNAPLPAGHIIKVGRLEFTSPYACKDLKNVEIALSGIRSVDNKSLSPIDFRLIYKND